MYILHIQVSHIRIFPVSQTHTAELILHIYVSHVRTQQIWQYYVSTHSRTHSAYMCVPYQNIICFHTHTHYSAHLQVSHQSNTLCPHTAQFILHTNVSHIRTYSVSTHTHIILRMSKSRIQSNIMFLHTAERILHIYMCPISEHILFPHTLSCTFTSLEHYSLSTHSRTHSAYVCVAYQNIFYFRTYSHYSAYVHQTTILSTHNTHTHAHSRTHSACVCISHQISFCFHTHLHTYVSQIRTLSVSTRTSLQVSH